jgi:hypothetical protein
MVSITKMNKIILCVLIFGLVACDSENKQEELEEKLSGIVINKTSCSGGPEPVYIIKLSEKDSIMTATLPDAFQIPNLNIEFKTKASSIVLFCTTDKIYPKDFDVFDVSLFVD